MNNAQAQIEKSIFAVMQVLYNEPGLEDVTCGIVGTAFLINDSTAITANHVLNLNLMTPDKDFKFVKYWLLNRAEKLIISLSVDYLKSIEEIDVTIIRLPESIKCNLKVSNCSINIKDSVRNYGHIGNCVPITNAHWDDSLLVIDEYDLDNCTSDLTGTIVQIKKETINASDIKLNDITVIQPSFKGVVGISGGPLLKNDEIIGLMSFGHPFGSDIKGTVFAISKDEIFTRLKKHGY